MKSLVTDRIGPRLLRVVFGWYFVVAITLTGIQIYSEYRQTKTAIFEEISRVGVAFEEYVSNAVWHFDLDQLNAAVEGIDRNAIVVGTLIESADGEVLINTIKDSNSISGSFTKGQSGSTFIGDYGKGSINEIKFNSAESSSDIYEYGASINYVNTGQGVNETIGVISIYTTRAAIIDNFKYSFLLILSNSIVKTIALWLIFMFFIRRVVSAPLTSLANYASNFNPDNPGQTGFMEATVNKKANDEIDILHNSFIKLQASVINSINVIETQNQTLERRVKERTETIEKINEKLVHVSLHDPLTHTPNRSLFEDRLEQMLLDASRESFYFAVASIDLRKFKKINDTLGHQAGDVVLCQIAQRMQDVLHDTDTVARMGGDEFALLLKGVNRDSAREIGERLIKCSQSAIVHEGCSIYAGLNIGFSIYPEDGTTARTLYKHADLAMYRAKQNENGLEMYTSLMQQDMDRQNTIAEGLSSTQFLDQLVVHYQPVVNGNNQQISGFEALVRWMHPKLGLIYPDEFIGITENSHLIKDLTLRVAKIATNDLSNIAEYGNDYSISINISAGLISDPGFPDYFCNLLIDSPIEARRMILEITESNAMSNPESIMDIMEKLKQFGFKLSMGDFGTGYSSFSYLTRLPFDELKIDRSFLMDENVNGDLVIQSIIEVAHRLNLRVVAEGVENETTVQFLKTLDCDYLQGYNYSPPLAFDKLKVWMNEYHTILTSNQLYRKSA